MEIAFTATSHDVITWFIERSANPETTRHVEAQRLLDLSGGVTELDQQIRRWEQLMESRPKRHRILARTGDIDDTYEHIEEIVESLSTGR